MQVTDRPSPDAPSLTQAIIVQMVYFCRLKIASRGGVHLYLLEQRFVLIRELGEPDWRCSKTCDGMLLSIRWNSRVSAVAENVAAPGRLAAKNTSNSCQRRSKRQLEAFLARKHASSDLEVADGPSIRGSDRQQPRRQVNQHCSQSENAS